MIEIHIRWKWIFDFLLILAICYVIYMSFAYSHEQVHSAICKSNGGDPTININYLKIGAITDCDYPSGKKPETAILADSFNEVIGYHYRHFVIFMIALMLVLYIKNNKKGI